MKVTSLAYVFLNKNHCLIVIIYNFIRTPTRQPQHNKSNRQKSKSERQRKKTVHFKVCGSIRNLIKNNGGFPEEASQQTGGFPDEASEAVPHHKLGLP